MEQVEQSIELPRWGYRGAVIALAVTLSVWLLSYLNLFSLIDGILYDQAMRMSVSAKQNKMHVLLVEVDRRKVIAEEEILAALDILDKLGAKRIILNFLPQAADSSFYSDLGTRENLLVSQGLEYISEAGYLAQPIPLPKEFCDLGVPVGVLSAPPSSHGIYRRQSLFLMINGTPYTTLEAKAGWKAPLQKLLNKVEQSALVDFSSGLHGIPHVSLENVLAETLISELVKDKYVIIGEKGTPSVPGLTTPISQNGEMSLLEFQGHTLNSFINGKTIRTLDAPEQLALLLILSTLALLVYQGSNVVIASWIATGSLVALTAAAYLIFAFFHWWIPLFELSTCQVLLFLFILRSKSVLSYQALKKLTFQTSSKLTQQYQHSNPDSPEDYWQQIFALVEQILDLRQSVFLSKTPGNKTLVVVSHSESTDSPFDGLPNIGNSPFREALAAKTPIRVKQLFKTARKSELQYLTPLTFSGNTLGFWAVSAAKTYVEGFPSFEYLLEQTSRQVATLLFHKQQLDKAPSRHNFIEKYLARTHEEGTYTSLINTLDLLSFRLNNLEHLLDGLSTAAIIFDLFGRVMNVNEYMMEILKDENMSPYEMSSLDFLTTFGALGTSQTRALLRHVIMEGGESSIPVTLSSRPDSKFTMVVRALRRQEGQRAKPTPFNLSGIICEMSDVSAFTQLSELKGLLAQRLGAHLRNDLGVIEMCSSLLEDDDMKSEERNDLLERVNTKIDKIIDTITECEKYISMDASVQERNCYPVDSQSHFKKAVDATNDIASERDVDFDIKQPRVMSYAMASAEGLEDVYSSILTVMVRDTADNGSVNIEILEEGEWIKHMFSNTGFGIPNERFQDYIYGSGASASEELTRLRAALQRVRAWGGELEAESEVGEGILMQLRLPRFI